MNVLITGGTGFIGSRLALRHRQSGDTVRILGQTNTPAEKENAALVEEAGCIVLLGSIADAGVVRQGVEDVDLVYHLAAAQHEFNVGDQHFWNVNVDGTRNLLDASASARVKRFVYGSTIGVYRAAPGTTVTEGTATEPDNIYGVTKLAAERLVHENMHRLSCVVVRISETYGPGDRRLLKLFRAIGRKRYFHIGRGSNLHHLLYIDDLTNALRLAGTVDTAVGEVITVPGYEAVTTQEMIETVALTLGAPMPKLRVPLWPLWIVAAAMELTLRPLGVHPPLHRRRMHFFVKSFRFEGARARKLLGYEPAVSVAAGMHATADWYRTRNLI